MDLLLIKNETHFSNVVAYHSDCKLRLQRDFKTGKNSFIKGDNFVKVYMQHFIKTYSSVFYSKKNSKTNNSVSKKYIS